MMEELSEHLIEHEVKGSVIHTIIDSMRVDQTQHSTGTSDERRAVEKELRRRPNLIRRLVQIFYYGEFFVIRCFLN
jgi:signal recognition particle GTPase